ncbi:MAG TPA: hypothetical protein VNT33_10530 [Telluria sp.]|nr:hypothetical protein [Telluria sp.]
MSTRSSDERPAAPAQATPAKPAPARRSLAAPARPTVARAAQQRTPAATADDSNWEAF